MRIFHGLLIFVVFAGPLSAERAFEDRKFFSKVFGQERNYRLFLPSDYDSSDRAYPVIYYFHGHSDRYTLEHYDNGTDTVPKIGEYVRTHPVIVVSVDGYVAEAYSGFYGGDPWDVREESGQYDFGEHFLELVGHIEGSLRVIQDRRHRATSGLSMGGFMSLYLSARYPDRIGSASAFNPGPEFYVGDPGRRVLWRPKDHVHNHDQSWVRLIRASGDYISQYHQETAEAYARAHKVRFEFRRDEFHKHAATSIAETFDFHQKAFNDPTLNNIPVEWSYSSPNSRFEVWGYEIGEPGEGKAIIYLDQVRQGGMRITTRRWAPDGPPLEDRPIRVKTAPIYKANTRYQILDFALKDGSLKTSEVESTSEGRLEFSVDGSGHQIGISGPGTGGQPPVLLPVSEDERLYVSPSDPISLPIRIFNPRGEPMERVEVTVTSDYPTVQFLKSTAVIERIEPGNFTDLSPQLQAQFVAGRGYYADARILVQMTYDGWYQTADEIRLAIEPEDIPAPDAVVILDGKQHTFQVFRQAGNRGGGSLIERTVTEGKGNGNGRLEPGEEATIWVKMAQGMDPFDKNSWYRCKVRSDSRWIEAVGDIQEEKQREWTGAQNRTSLIRLATDAPARTRIPLILENESWSFHYTPDVRYGTELLFQAFQLHTFHLHRLVLETNQEGSVEKSDPHASGVRVSRDGLQ